MSERSRQMLIDDEYSQYEMFRIINKAGVDAIAHFEAEKEECAKTDDPEAARQAALNSWEAEAAAQKAAEESTEESVYGVTYSEKMLSLWKNELGR